MILIAFFSHYFFGFTISLLSCFLILLVLVQRGRGGGLTGALGGPGGQSAFGTKAGDLFTRITIGVATVWIFLCGAAVFTLREGELPDTGGALTSGLNPPAGATGAIGGAAIPKSGDSTDASGTDAGAAKTVEPDAKVGDVQPSPASPDAAKTPAVGPAAEASTESKKVETQPSAAVPPTTGEPATKGGGEPSTKSGDEPAAKSSESSPPAANASPTASAPTGTPEAKTVK